MKKFYFFCQVQTSGDQELNKFDCLRHLFQSQLEMRFHPLCLYAHCNFLKF